MKNKQSTYRSKSDKKLYKVKESKGQFEYIKKIKSEYDKEKNRK